MVICIDELIRKFRNYLKNVLGVKEFYPLDKGWDHSFKVRRHWIEIWYQVPIGLSKTSRMKILPLSNHAVEAFKKVEGAIITAEDLGMDFRVKHKAYCSVCGLHMVLTKNGSCCWECYSKCDRPDSCRFCR